MLVGKTKIPDYFNQYYSSIGKELFDRLLNDNDSWCPCKMEWIRNSIEEISTTKEEVLEKIDQLQNCNNFHDCIILKHHQASI